MNPLENFPNIRTKVYIVLGLLGLALGSAQVGFSAAQVAQPTWLTVGLSVYAFLGAGLGYTAKANVTQGREEIPTIEDLPRRGA